MQSAPPWIVLAHILRPQGRKGEVLAELLTDFPERFTDFPTVWLAPPEFIGSATSARQAEVLSFWLPVGRNAGRIVLHFSGVDSIELAETLGGKDVLVPSSERLPLEEGAAYISDLVGSTVYDRSQAIGIVDSVQFPTSSDGLRRLEEAAPLLSILTPEGDEVLVPFASAFVLEIDAAAKSIRMTLPEGLIEINRPTSK